MPCIIRNRQCHARERHAKPRRLQSLQRCKTHQGSINTAIAISAAKLSSEALFVSSPDVYECWYPFLSCAALICPHWTGTLRLAACGIAVHRDSELGTKRNALRSLERCCKLEYSESYSNSSSARVWQPATAAQTSPTKSYKVLLLEKDKQLCGKDKQLCEGTVPSMR